MPVAPRRSGVGSVPAVPPMRATAASVLARMYRFHASTLDLLSIQLLVYSSMPIATSAHTPSMISCCGPLPPNNAMNTAAMTPDAARPATTPR